MITRERAITLPLKIDRSGNIQWTNDTNRIWDDRVISVIGTVVGTRVRREAFGTQTTSVLFDSQTQFQESITHSVEGAFNTYLKSLRFISTTVTRDPHSGADHVTIKYALPDLSQSDTSISIGHLILKGDLPFVEDTP